eukprot:Gb_24224 [translate_table: standard]
MHQRERARGGEFIRRVCYRLLMKVFTGQKRRRPEVLMRLFLQRRRCSNPEKARGADQADIPARHWVDFWCSYIGIEFTDAYMALGSEVTFVEASNRLMPDFDPEIQKLAQRVLINPRRIHYHTCVLEKKITVAKDGKPVTIELIDAKIEGVKGHFGGASGFDGMVRSSAISKPEERHIKRRAVLNLQQSNIKGLQEVTVSSVEEGESFLTQDHQKKTPAITAKEDGKPESKPAKGDGRFQRKVREPIYKLLKQKQGEIIIGGLGIIKVDTKLEIKAYNRAIDVDKLDDWTQELEVDYGKQWRCFNFARVYPYRGHHAPVTAPFRPPLGPLGHPLCLRYFFLMRLRDSEARAVPSQSAWQLWQQVSTLVIQEFLMLAYIRLCVLLSSRGVLCRYLACRGGWPVLGGFFLRFHLLVLLFISLRGFGV